MPSRISELMDDDSDADIEEIILPPVSEAETEQRRVHDRVIRAELWRIQKLARDTNYTPEEIIENRRGQGSLDPTAAAELLELLEASARWRDPEDPWELKLGQPAGPAEAGAAYHEGGSIDSATAQEIMDDETSSYSQLAEQSIEHFQDFIQSPEARDIAEMMMPGGTLKKGLGSMMDDLFDIMKRGREMGKTSVKRSKESEKYWDDAADRSKQARSDRIARENIEESRRSISEATTPEGTIRIERTVNPKTGWREDKLKGGGHVYKKGYYGKSYR